MAAGTDSLAGLDRLYTAVLSDVLDSLGRMDRAMGPHIRPLDDTLILVGRARTARYVEVDGVADGHNPYALEIALIDSLAPGEVAVMACGGSTRIAPWGELLSTATRARGAAGCVTDGFVRDVKRIRAMGFPVFHGGIAPLDSRGRGEVAEIDVPVLCGGVRVAPGGPVPSPARKRRECHTAPPRMKMSQAAGQPCQPNSVAANIALSARPSPAAGGKPG